MIDRADRNLAALLLRRFADNRINSDDFVNLYPYGSQDDGVRAVEDRAWALYDDLFPHYLDAQPELRSELARWVLFLRSETEYTWPQFRFIRLGIPCWLNWLWGGHLQRRQNAALERFARSGEISVWPFRTQAECDKACAQNFLLAGRT